MTPADSGAIPVRDGPGEGAVLGTLTVAVVGSLVELGPNVGQGGPRGQLYLTAATSRQLAIKLLQASEGAEG